jgi:cation-transporting ATPase E
VTASLLTLNALAPLAGTATPEQVSSASVLTLSIVGLWILSAVSRPLNAGRLAVVVAMSASLVALLNLPLAQEFFLLSRPPGGLLLAAVACGATGGLGVEVLARVHARTFPVQGLGWK